MTCFKISRLSLQPSRLRAVFQKARLLRLPSRNSVTATSVCKRLSMPAPPSGSGCGQPCFRSSVSLMRTCTMTFSLLVRRLKPGRILRTVALVAAGGGGFVLVMAMPLLHVNLPLHIYTIRSASMRPTLHPGDIVIVRQLYPRDYRVGDTVTCFPPGSRSPVTHRITRLVTTDAFRLAYTRGDNNALEDPRPVLVGGCAGKVVGRLPLAGYGWAWLRTVSGFLVLNGLITLAATVFLIRWACRRPAVSISY